MKELGSGTAYNTHSTTSLIRTLKYVSDILQTEEAFTVEEYKHTHTHTQRLSRWILIERLRNIFDKKYADEVNVYSYRFADIVLPT